MSIFIIFVHFKKFLVNFTKQLSKIPKQILLWITNHFFSIFFIHFFFLLFSNSWFILHHWSWIIRFPKQSWISQNFLDNFEIPLLKMQNNFFLFEQYFYHFCIDFVTRITDILLNEIYNRYFLCGIKKNLLYVFWKIARNKFFEIIIDGKKSVWFIHAKNLTIKLFFQNLRTQILH